MIPALAFLELTPIYIILGFCLYRAMDILKPPPARQFERIKGGWGIMLDDLAAAVYTNLILRLIISLHIF